MKGFVDVRLFLSDNKGRRIVNAEAIIANEGRVKKVNDKRYGDLIVPQRDLIDFDTLVCLAEDQNRIDEIDSKDGITFYNVPAEFSKKKYDTKDEYYYEIKVHLGNDEFYVNRCFFLHGKQLYRLKKIKTSIVFDLKEKEEGDITPDDLKDLEEKDE